MNSNYLKVFLDGTYDFNDYIKQHVTFVNYVRDRFDADVHLIVTSQTTASNGTEYTLFFLGQQNFLGKNDTLKYVANTNNTFDETRNGITNIMKLRFMRYVAALPEASQICNFIRRRYSREADNKSRGQMEELGIHG